MTDTSGIPPDLLNSCDCLETARVLAAQRGTFRPRDLGWDSVYFFDAPGTRDKRVAVAVYAKLGLHPIIIHGLQDDGSCTCGQAECTKSAGKHPISRGWQTERLDVERLDRQLQKNWRLNVGLRMGRQPDGSFLVAFDIDGPRSLLGDLETELGALPPTLTARTGSGGIHMICRCSGPIANRVRLVQADGGQVDIRGEGGQVVVSPSLHRSSNHYRWTDVQEPARLPE
ncbi:MAG: bifunctional DNA primase/polymerase [Polyangiaceae bacterium]|nr:bifunctional DNA primase/polymerase [Polyangiaceae bacterium]